MDRRDGMQTVLLLMFMLFLLGIHKPTKLMGQECSTSNFNIWVWQIQLTCSYVSNIRFIVKKGTPGFTATKIENKIAVRVVQNGDIVLKEVFVPDEDRLVGINSFQDTAKVVKSFCIILINKGAKGN